jgi:hypothetical protein
MSEDLSCREVKVSLTAIIYFSVGGLTSLFFAFSIAYNRAWKYGSEKFDVLEATCDGFLALVMGSAWPLTIPIGALVAVNWTGLRIYHWHEKRKRL